MSTQIVDNFQLNVAKPIDSRMVTYGAASRSAIQYPYEGLRIYDVQDQKPYVYISGAWKAESGAGSGSGSVSLGTNQRLVKYTSNSTIGDSAIWDKGTYAAPSIGIGMEPSSGNALTVKGNIKINAGDGGFNGDGSDIVNINGNNIKPNSIPVTKLVASTANNQILVTENGVVKWVDNINSGVVITNRAPPSTSQTPPDNATHYLLFAQAIGSPTGNSIYANNYGSGNKLIGVKPSTSQILASGDTTNTQSLPSYTFSGNTTSGLYGLSDEIGLSYGGKGLVKLNSSQLSILNVGQATVLSSRSNGVLFGSDRHTYQEVSFYMYNPDTGLYDDPIYQYFIPEKYPLIISKNTSSAAEPSYTWNGDTGTGMYRPADYEVALTTNGDVRFKVTNSMTTISNATTLSSTLTVSGLTTINNKLVVVSTSDFAFDLTSSASGIILKTNGEFIKSIQNPTTSGTGHNFMSFYKDVNTRRGYIGYGNNTDNNLYIYNEVSVLDTLDGNIHLGTRATDRVIISSEGLKLKNVSDGDVSIDTSLSGINNNGIFRIKSNGSTKMRIGSSDIKVDTPLRISGASFTLDADTSNYFGFVQGDGAGIYGYTTLLNPDPLINGSVGLRIKGGGGAKAIDISNIETKSYLTLITEGDVKIKNGVSIGLGNSMKIFFAGSIEFDYNWNSWNGNASQVFKGWPGKGGVGEAVRGFNNLGSVAVSGTLPNGISITDPMQGKCVITANYGKRTSWQIVQCTNLNVYANGDQIVATMYTTSSLPNGNLNIQVEFMLTLLV